MSAKYTISLRVLEEDTNDGCAAIEEQGQAYPRISFHFMDAKEKKAALAKAKAWIAHRVSFELVRYGTVIWHPPVKVSDKLLEKARSAVASWHGIDGCKIDQGAITAADWPRGETGRSSLRAYLEGLDDALTCS